MSIALVTAFSGADTGARTVTADVVTDASAYLALEANANSAHDGFVSVSAGKITVAFDGNNLAASGSGINVDGAYEFDSLVKITNKGTETKSVDITIGGTDSALCTVALTSTEAQSTPDYSGDPTALSLAATGSGYLGLKVSGSGKATGESVACSITVTAS